MNQPLDFKRLFHARAKILAAVISREGTRGYFVTEHTGIIQIQYWFSSTDPESSGIPVTDPAFWNTSRTIVISMLENEHHSMLTQLAPNLDPGITGQIIAKFTVGGVNP